MTKGRWWLRSEPGRRGSFRHGLTTATAMFLSRHARASGHSLCRSRKRPVDHVDRVLEAIHRHERAEARSFFLPEQDLVEHVEPVERDAGLAVLRLDLAGLVEEWLAPADLVDHLLDLLRTRIVGELGERVAQVEQRRALGIARLAKPLLRQYEIAEIVDGIADQRGELWVRLRRHARTIATDEAPQRLGVLRVRGGDQREQHRERDRNVGL